MNPFEPRTATLVRVQRTPLLGASRGPGFAEGSEGGRKTPEISLVFFFRLLAALCITARDAHSSTLSSITTAGSLKGECPCGHAQPCCPTSCRKAAPHAYFPSLWRASLAFSMRRESSEPGALPWPVHSRRGATASGRQLPTDPGDTCPCPMTARLNHNSKSQTKQPKSQTMSCLFPLSLSLPLSALSHPGHFCFRWEDTRLELTGLSCGELIRKATSCVTPEEPRGAIRRPKTLPFHSPQLQRAHNHATSTSETFLRRQT